MKEQLPIQGASLADVINHARDFAGVVATRAPALYLELLDNPRVRALLGGGGRFNEGKLLAWAEYLVFRREFRERFPETSAADCVNAFSALFLKNDISVTNLLELMESDAGEELSMLVHGQAGERGWG